MLLHGGIALLMFGELYTAQYVGEAQMRITEGEDDFLRRGYPLVRTRGDRRFRS